MGLTAPGVLPGCLIVNDMAAGLDPTAARRYIELLESGLRACLQRADALGEATAADIDDRTRLIGSAVVGINLASKLSSDSTEIKKLVDAVISQVRNWSVR